MNHGSGGVQHDDYEITSTCNSDNLYVEEESVTYLPLPFPSLAPSMIPGRFNNCILAPLCLMTPGMQVNVVNSYAAILEKDPVNLVNNVDFPTDGNPIIPTLASPLLDTSKPSPAVNVYIIQQQTLSTPLLRGSINHFSLQFS